MEKYNVTRLLSIYIKHYQLYDKCYDEDGNLIITNLNFDTECGSKLKSLFNPQPTDKVTFMTMQQYIQHHFKPLN